MINRIGSQNNGNKSWIFLQRVNGFSHDLNLRNNCSLRILSLGKADSST